MFKIQVSLTFLPDNNTDRADACLGCVPASPGALVEALGSLLCSCFKSWQLVRPDVW